VDLCEPLWDPEVGRYDHSNQPSGSIEGGIKER
jgi:hypothetical protein